MTRRVGCLFTYVPADSYRIGSPKTGVYVVKGSAATITKTVIRNRIMSIV